MLLLTKLHMLKRSRLKKTQTKKNGIDKNFLIMIISLILFGVFMVYESSSVYAMGNFGDKYKFVVLQSGWIFVGLIGMFIFSNVDLNFLRDHSKHIYLGIIILLFITMLPTPFTPEVYGARRWFVVNPVPFPTLPIIGRAGFQPSELAKLVSIVFLSGVLSKDNKKFKDNDKGELARLIVVGGFSLLVTGLVALEPDFTTALIIISILGGMYFLAGAPLKYLFISAPVFISGVAMYAFSSEYRRVRIATLFNPDNAHIESAGYHIRQIMIALGSGGFFGLGQGMSRQKYFYLPEPTSDSIFAVVGEEFGFLGTTILILAFVMLIMKGFSIGRSVENLFYKYIVYGVMLWFSIQVMINIGVMGRILPVTGVPLPLISYGGSSMIFILCGLGLVLNVSRYAKLEK